MTEFHKSNLKPLSEGEPVWGLMPSKMSDEQLKAMADEAYATPRGILMGVFYGFLAWGVLFAIGYAVMRFF